MDDITYLELLAIVFNQQSHAYLVVWNIQAGQSRLFGVRAYDSREFP